MVNGYAPITLEEALRIRAQESVVPYAGGTDLMVQNRRDVEYLFLNKIDELKQIKLDKDYIRIGAMVTFTQAMNDDKVPQIMKDAISKIAAPAIRNAGTFGGNLGNGSDKADSVLIEFAVDAKLRLMSSKGERIVDVDDFCITRRKIDLKDDELITEVLIPNKPYKNYIYQKVGGRNSLAISHVAFAGLFEEENEKIQEISAAFIADAGRVLRFKDIEQTLIGKTKEEAKNQKEKFIKAYSDKIVLTAGRVSAEYRKTVSLNLLSNFLTQFGV